MTDIPARQVVPPPTTGYQLDPGTGFFAAVFPLGVDKVNFVQNPSPAINLSGYNPNGMVLTQDAQHQRRSAFAIKAVPQAMLATVTYQIPGSTGILLTAGLTYFFSLDMLAPIGTRVRLWFGQYNSYAQIGQSMDFQATGLWQRMTCAYTEVQTTGRSVTVQLVASPHVPSPLWFDGWQIEVDQPTTYIDGNQRGFIRGRRDYYWTGKPYASTSVRIGQSRAGGELVGLNRVGFKLISVQGLGLGGIINQSQPLARGGSYYGGTTQSDRQFSLTGQVDGDSLVPLQQQRQALVDLFKPDVVSPPQPVKLIYQPLDECGNPVGNESEITCLYEDGLPGAFNNLNSERMALTFRLFSLHAMKEVGVSGAIIAYQQGIQTYEGLMRRAPDGTWHQAGSSPVAATGSINIMVEGLDGKIYVGGNFTSMQGVANTRFLARWNPVNLAWEPVGTGAAGGSVGIVDMKRAPDGTITVTGDFTSLGGAANTAFLGSYDPNANTFLSLGAVVPGASAYPGPLAWSSSGELYWAPLQITSVNGVAGHSVDPTTSFDLPWVLKRTNGAWGQVAQYSGPGAIATIVPDKYHNVLLGGQISTLGGVTVNGLARWNPTAKQVEVVGDPAYPGIGTVGQNNTVNAIVYMPDGTIIIGGAFVMYPTADAFTHGVYIRDIARRQGNSWRDLAGGTDINRTAYTTVTDLTVLPDGTLLASGIFTTAGGVSTPSGLAVWNDSAWVPINVFAPGAVVQATVVGQDGSLYIAINQNQLFLTAGSTVVNNFGSSATGIKLDIYGPGQVYSIKNLTTGKSIYFDLILADGEVATLDLSDPAKINFTSSFRGPIINAILPGSQEADFGLAPGKNIIAAFIAGTTSGNTQIQATWEVRHHSLDGALPNRLLP